MHYIRTRCVYRQRVHGAEFIVKRHLCPLVGFLHVERTVNRPYAQAQVFYLILLFCAF